MTRAEKQQQLKDAINKVLQNEPDNVKRIKNAKEFYFKIAQERFKELSEINPLNPEDLKNKINTFIEREGLDRRPISKAKTFSYPLYKEKFNVQKPFSKFYPEISVIENPELFYVFTLIGECIAFFDSHGFNNSGIWNVEKRHVARARVNQDEWINNTLDYLTNNKQTDNLPVNIKNTFDYILNPNSNSNVVSLIHRQKIFTIIVGENFTNNNFDFAIANYFNNNFELDRPLVRENIHCWFTRILYESDVRKVWDVQTRGVTKDGKTHIEFGGIKSDKLEELDDSSQENIEPENNQPPPPIETKNLNKDKVELENTENYHNSNIKPSRKFEPTLDVEKTASVLANTITQFSKNEEGQMVGIFGRWGRGKSYLVEQIFNELVKHKSNKYIRVNFQAWKYQEEPGVWAYLYETFANEFYKNPDSENIFDKKVYLYKRIIQLNFKTHGYTALILFLLSCFVSLIASTELKLHALWIPLIPLANLISKTDFNKQTAQQLFKKYAHKKTHVKHLGIQAEIQNDLAKMLEVWIKESELTVSKLILFVDDLDRCNHIQILSILDSLRVVLDNEIINKRLIIITAVDDEILKKCVVEKIGKSNRKDHRDYVDKLFLLTYKLGILNDIEKIKILENITKGNVAPPSKSENVKPKLVINQTTDNKGNVIPILSTSNQRTDPNHSPKTQNFVPIISKPDSKFYLSADEFTAMQNSIYEMQSATPRSLIIFYYRYLLAKNFATILYGVELQLKIYPIFLNLLAKYTTVEQEIPSNPNFVGQEKTQTITYNLTMDIKLLQLGLLDYNKDNIPEESIHIIYSLLEMTIAY